MFEAISMHPNPSNPSILMTCKNIYVFLSKFPLTLTQKRFKFDANFASTSENLSLSFFSLRACMSACLSVSLSVSLSVCLPFSKSVSLPVCLSACLPVCLSACLSGCLPVCMSACLPVCPVCLSVYLSVCLSVCLSVYLSVWQSVLLHYVCANLIHSSSPAHLQKAKNTKQNHTYLIYKCVCLDHSLVIHR